MEVARLERLAERYESEGKEEKSWLKLVQAHALYSSCFARRPYVERRRKAYEVQRIFWQDCTRRGFSSRATLPSYEEQCRITERLKGSLRAKRYQSNEKLSAIQAERALSDPYGFMDEVKELTYDVTDQIVEFISSIIQEGIRICGEAPGDYAVVALGSLARAEATFYSDLEFMFVISNENTEAYFQDLAVTVYFLIANLGETKLKCMNIQELQNLTEEHCSGVKIDGFQRFAGNIPTGNGTTSQENRFICTIDELEHLYHSVLNNPSGNAARGDVTAMLTTLRLICGRSTLFERLKDTLASIRANEARWCATMGMIKRDISEYAYFPSPNGKDEVRKAKEDFYRYPSLLIYNLKIYYELRTSSAEETLAHLEEDKRVSSSIADDLLFLLYAAIYLRMKAYAFYQSQMEDVLVSISYTPSSGAYAIPRPLVIMLTWVSRSLKDRVRYFVQNHIGGSNFLMKRGKEDRQARIAMQVPATYCM